MTSFLKIKKKARVEEASNATRAAVEEGVIPGGGVALIRCMKALDKIDASGEEKNGIEILKRTLGEPVRQIAENTVFEGSPVIAVFELLKTEGISENGRKRIGIL